MGSIYRRLIRSHFSGRHNSSYSPLDFARDLLSQSWPAFLTSLLLLRILECLRCARSDFWTYCQVRLRGPRGCGPYRCAPLPGRLCEPVAGPYARKNRRGDPPPAQRISKSRSPLLTTTILVFGKTVPAIHRTIFPGFERDFALLFAIGTDGLMHLSRTSIVSSILKSHAISP